MSAAGRTRRGGDAGALRLAIGGVGIVLRLAHGRALTRLARKRYRAFETRTRPAPIRIDLDVVPPRERRRISDPTVDPVGGGWRIAREDFAVDATGVRRWRGRVEESLYALDAVLRIVLSLLLPARGGVLVHAAGIRVGRGGIAFVGRSGLGKTTLSRKAPVRDVLNDEIVILRRAERWRLYGSPFWGDMARDGGARWRRSKPGPVPLAAVAHLARGRRGAPAGAAGLLRNVVQFSARNEEGLRILRHAARLARDVPQFRFRFRRSDSWKKIARALSARMV